MQRFFVEFPLQIDMNITDANLLHQIGRVLRSKPGDTIVLFDGDGYDNVYEIIRIEKAKILLKGVNRYQTIAEPKKALTLYQALPNKYEKIEYILEKGVEIGVSRFIFFKSAYSQKLIITPKKIERFRTIAQEALEQCMGASMPEIIFLDMFDPEYISSEVYLLTTEMHGKTLQELNPSKNITLLVGPEGGWNKDEQSMFLEQTYIPVRIGRRILRTETAGIVIGFALLWGNG